jgi:hypothetical protein
VILTLPVLVLVTMAVVQFGLLVSRQQHLVDASRAGALRAARIPLATEGPVPKEVRVAVARQLQFAGITASHIRLEHGGGSDQAQLDEKTFVLHSGTLDPLPARNLPPPTTRPFVRVTVYVEAPQLAPNLLQGFGVDLAGRQFERTATYPRAR